MSYEKFFPPLSFTHAHALSRGREGGEVQTGSRPSRYGGERSLEFEMMPSWVVVVGGNLQRRKEAKYVLFGFMAIIDIFVLCKPLIFREFLSIINSSVFSS